jgi:cold-inducible RNA-binding protein
MERKNQMTNIFVGNLSYQTRQDELEAAFAAYGAVERVSVVTDRDTGQPRGFAFIEMTNGNEATNAIAGLNGAELNGRALNVNEARPREERGGGNRGGNGGLAASGANHVGNRRPLKKESHSERGGFLFVFSLFNRAALHPRLQSSSGKRTVISVPRAVIHFPE